MWLQTALAGFKNSESCATAPYQRKLSPAPGHRNWSFLMSTPVPDQPAGTHQGLDRSQMLGSGEVRQALRATQQETLSGTQEHARFERYGKPVRAQDISRRVEKYAGMKAVEQTCSEARFTQYNQTSPSTNRQILTLFFRASHYPFSFQSPSACNDRMRHFLCFYEENTLNMKTTLASLRFLALAHVVRGGAQREKSKAEVRFHTQKA